MGYKSITRQEEYQEAYQEYVKFRDRRWRGTLRGWQYFDNWRWETRYRTAYKDVHDFYVPVYEDEINETKQNTTYS